MLRKMVEKEHSDGYHVGRFCQEHGHEPRLMSPLYVRAYVKVHKNADRDTEAIAEASTRPSMSFGAIKSEESVRPSVYE